MAITPTTLLSLPLITTGSESGQWGYDVNNGLTSYLDIVIAGTQTISGTQTAVTLSLTAGDSSATNISQVGTGATGSSQYQVINCTGSPASLLTITAPASSKTFVVINATTTSQSVKIVGAGPTPTGVTLVSGEKAHVAWNGSDFVKTASTVITNSTGVLTVPNGGTGVSTLSGVVYGNAASVMTAATGAQISTAIGATAVQNATAATTATTSTNLAGGAANRIPYQTGSGVTTFLAAPTISGTVVGWTGSAVDWVSAPAASSATNLSGGSAGVVPYQSGTGTTLFTAPGTPGYYLQSNGTSAPTWTAVNALPSQTSNSGKYLTTDGTNASWAYTGASANGVIWENSVTITANYTLTTSKNGLSVGPITINSGCAVTVPSGQRWVVL